MRTGINDWAKMKGSRGKNKARKLQTHFSSTSHAAALKEFSSFVRDDNRIESLMTKQQRQVIVDREMEMCKSREVIEMLLDVARTLTRNGLALRGDESDDNGNFRQIVKLISRYNPTMKAWLDNRSSRKYRTSYLSAQSQNEFIMLLGGEVKQVIEDRVKQSGLCCVMADTTPDISNQDELSVAVRFINTKSCKPEERLVKVAETKDKTGAGQATDILGWLKSSGIPLSTVQFQTYDSTASMSGCNKGAQQKVSEALGRRIPYTKCLPHGTNLVIEHACEASPLISKIFNSVQQLYVFFSKSTKRHSQLKEAMKEVESALKLRKLSQTR